MPAEILDPERARRALAILRDLLPVINAGAIDMVSLTMDLPDNNPARRSAYAAAIALGKAGRDAERLHAALEFQLGALDA